MDFEISAGQVKALLKQGGKLTLLDVREPWELEKARLEGSKNIPWATSQLAPTRSSILMNILSWYAITGCVR